jgi:hypothetical protein
LVVEDSKKGWKLTQNSRYRPRTASEIEGYAARTR